LSSVLQICLVLIIFIISPINLKIKSNANE